MPLLRKRSFEKASAPEFLRDDEEVFYCEITNEIFRNYEEFAERMLLCTSMVWTCCMTGKSNLTYEEALESEENAKKSIEEFPVELKIPILYVGSKTKRTGFGEMAEDVFSFCKDRYFIGEKLETSFTGNKWVDSHVLQVIAPTAEEMNKSQNKGTTNPGAPLYKYEIEHLDAEDEDISEIMIVDYNQIRRKKTLFNREKCKLFLKQYVEQGTNGHWIIKPSTLKQFGIENMAFDRIFSGPQPSFESSKKLERTSSDRKKPAQVNGKKPRQETLAKFLTKSNGTEKVNGNVERNEASNAKKNTVLLQQMEKRKEEFEKMRLQKEAERLAQKEKQKKATIEIGSQIKQWQKPKEDLELENHQPLPNFPVINSRIPDEHIGEVLMFMECVKTFEKFLKCRNFFQSGVTFDIMERALLEEEVAGPLIDIIQMFLTTLFREQEEENNEYSMQLAKASFLQKIDINNMNLEDASKFATLAAKWPKERQGLSVRNLPLYSLTVSEVLRMHLLASGAKLQEAGEKGRFSQRGGYSYTDDPGLYFRLHNPHVLRSLAVKNVVQLKVKHKMAILTCLMEQLLTYADIRDAIEERIENNRQFRFKLKMAQSNERKRENELSTAKYHIKKDARVNKEDPKITASTIEKLEADAEKRKLQNDRQIDTYKKSAYDKEMFLGQDRAYRKYYKLESVPGLFIDSVEVHPGVCLPERVEQIPELVDVDKTAIISYFRKNWNKLNSSDKENSPVENSPTIMNGTSPSENSQSDLCAELLICSANEETCVVHSKDRVSSSWKFVPNVEMLETLVKTLNERGFREQELSQTLQDDKETLMKFIKQTPVQNLNRDFDVPIEEEARSRIATRAKKSYVDANFGFPVGTTIEEILQSTLTDDILELEEKIYSGSLGQLRVKNRDAWRDALLNKDYENFNREIIRRVYVDKDKKVEAEEEEESTEIKCRYGDHDPGTFLGHSKKTESDSEDEDNPSQSEEMKTAVECLATALAQVAQAVELKFLQKPLGDSTDRTLATYIPSRNRLDSWEHSLLASTSFSQVFLHYSTLDSCVMWSRSTLLAKCKICRGQKDSENMLLCDSCNLGHHLYCLKPKLTSIPKGDWFCDRCTTAKEKENRKCGSEILPRKKRRLFKEEQEEDLEEEAEEEIDNEEQEEYDEQEESDKDSDYEEESSTSKVELCSTCNSGGVLIKCDSCSSSFHKECVDPPLRRSKPNWVCQNCKDNVNDERKQWDNNNKSNRPRRSNRESKPKEEEDEDEETSTDSDNYPLAHHAAGVNNERRSAAKARHNIYNFVKSLRRLSSSDDDSESNHNRSNRKRSFRRAQGRDDLPLHNAALQDLLTEVMKHTDAWPFLRPVQKNEVPDYYDVITNPMDFGTIKYKLNMGEYSTDSQLMFDVALIFQNCSTYNEVNTEIFRCGERLLEFFRNKCLDMGLEIPRQGDEEDDSDKKKPRK